MYMYSTTNSPQNPQDSTYSMSHDYIHTLQSCFTITTIKPSKGERYGRGAGGCSLGMQKRALIIHSMIGLAKDHVRDTHLP